ncbi:MULTISPECIES: hypothetical protein [unclassified Bradyrhizobium]|jgi:hypothetical protein|uniref:hypothetical protein n=1 Tax=unclassified Bradyrhizobium TaxID=2631580 RepID=UPI0004913AB7|nr:MULTISPECIES: hypothetical protein [unclassified Bradyrhizobium]QIG95975.1 hypothetical protein G6P99_28660 [Bradyrhizobium sp. 6(2017)]
MIEGLKPYVAFGVDPAGVARATYELRCSNDEEARRQAEDYLDAHEFIELWIDYKRIARLKRSRSRGSSQ